MLKSFHDLFLKFSVSPLAIHINEHSLSIWGFPRGSDGKESTCNAGDLGSILVWEDLLEKGMATCSSILAWRIPWTEETGGLQSMGSQRVRHDWATNTFMWLSKTRDWPLLDRWGNWSPNTQALHAVNFCVLCYKSLCPYHLSLVVPLKGIPS